MKRREYFLDGVSMYLPREQAHMNISKLLYSHLQ